MDAFFCITLSAIVLRKWWKSGKNPTPEHRRNTVKNRWERKKKLTTDEIITVVIPTIENDGK